MPAEDLSAAAALDRVEARRAVRPASKLMQRVQVVCDECGGSSICADAAARWSIESQCWEVSTVYDKGRFCDDCSKEVGTSEEPIDETPLAALRLLMQCAELNQDDLEPATRALLERAAALVAAAENGGGS